MERIEKLQKEWRESGRFRSVHATMALEKDGLVLGAKTFLARRNRDGALALDGAETRLRTLLAVAYGGPVDAAVFGAIRSASRSARLGNESLAAMQIALAKLPRLDDPQDAARRLFIADGLIAEGVDPRDIWTALEFDQPCDALEKLYNPEEQRNPPGDGRLSGEWTSSSSGAGDNSTATIEFEPSRGATTEALSGAAVRAMAERAARQFGTVGAAAIPGLDALDAFATMTTGAGTAPLEGKVPGRPDLKFTWNEDEGTLRIYQPPYPEPVLVATLGPKRWLYTRERKVARLLTTGIQINLAALAEAVPKEEDRLQECPTERPDRGGGGRKADLDYEDYIKAQNNVPPTKRGYGYWLMNPYDKRPVVVDDCVIAQKKIVEIKNGYAGFVSTPVGRMWMSIDWAYQATRQEQAWGDKPIEWDFSDKAAADWARKEFSCLPWLARIDVEWKPWRGHK